MIYFPRGRRQFTPTERLLAQRAWQQSHPHLAAQGLLGQPKKGMSGGAKVALTIAAVLAAVTLAPWR